QPRGPLAAATGGQIRRKEERPTATQKPQSDREKGTRKPSHNTVGSLRATVTGSKGIDGPPTHRQKAWARCGRCGGIAAKVSMDLKRIDRHVPAPPGSAVALQQRYRWTSN